MAKLSIDGLELNGKRVLVRVDFNVPLAKGPDGEVVVSDDTRIRAALPTIQAILDSGGLPILLSHLGRPGGRPVPELSLAPVAEVFAGILNVPVAFLPQTIGAEVEAFLSNWDPGDVVLLENTRFLPGEKKNDASLARSLSRLGDVFVNDAFGTAHRAHASTVGVAQEMPIAAMGYLMQREVNYLGQLLNDPEKPFIGLVGGAKVSDKIGVIENLLERVDDLLIGGAMSYTFLRASGAGVGRSLVEQDHVAAASDLLRRAQGRIHLPVDHVVADEISDDAPSRILTGDIPDDAMGLDIGPKTVEAYRRFILDAHTIVWNGPMGVFEFRNFATGTHEMAQALVDATDRGALSVVGGGDSVAAISEAGFSNRISHVSTGGGAMLEFLEGRTLPGLAALTDCK